MTARRKFWRVGNVDIQKSIKKNLPPSASHLRKSFRIQNGRLATPLKRCPVPSPETSRQNLAKAKANWRPPLPWRGPQETRLIKALAWRWYTLKEPRCGGRQIARWLGVSHTYVQKLVREFDGDTRNVVQQERAYGPATFADLRRAQEETIRLREGGWLRHSLRVPHRDVTFEIVNVRSGFVPSPRGGITPCDPLVEVKYESMLVAEESKKVEPIPFFRRRTRRRHS